METIKQQQNQIEEFSCAICLNLLVEPCTVKCNHSFCKSCLEEMVEILPENSDLNCPLCRSKIQQNNLFQINYNLENEIKQKFPQDFEKAKQLLQEKKKFVQMCKTLKFEYGNLHNFLNNNESNCHSWTIFIKLVNGNISDYVEKVEFQLHNTFNPNKVVISQPPFKLTRLGWGVFDIPIKIYWKKSFYEKFQIPKFHEIDHYLSFIGNGESKFMNYKYEQQLQQNQQIQQ